MSLLMSLTCSSLHVYENRISFRFKFQSQNYLNLFEKIYMQMIYYVKELKNPPDISLTSTIKKLSYFCYTNDSQKYEDEQKKVLT